MSVAHTPIAAGFYRDQNPHYYQKHAWGSNLVQWGYSPLFFEAGESFLVIFTFKWKLPEFETSSCVVGYSWLGSELTKINCEEWGGVLRGKQE